MSQYNTKQSSASTSKSNKSTEMNQLLIDSYRGTITPYDSSKGTIHLLVTLLHLNKSLAEAAVFESFYASSTFHPTKRLPSATEIENSKPDKKDAELTQRQQARLDALPKIERTYEALLAQYPLLPNALLKVPVNNTFYDIDDTTNQVVTPTSSSGSTHRGPHPDLLPTIQTFNAFFSGTTVPELVLGAGDQSYTPLTLVQLRAAAELYTDSEGLFEPTNQWIQDLSQPLPKSYQARADTIYAKQLEQYQRTKGIVEGQKKAITQILFKCFNQNLLLVHKELLQSCRYSEMISSLHKLEHDTDESALAAITREVNDFAIPSSIPWDQAKQIIFTLFQLEYTQSMIVNLKGAYNPAIHLPEAMKNCGGVKTAAQILTDGEVVYFSDVQQWTKWINILQHSDTPNYYKAIMTKDVDNIQNKDKSVSYILRCIDHQNRLKPYEPPIPKRVITEITPASSPTPVTDTKRSRYEQQVAKQTPVATVDLHEQQPFRLQKGIKINSATGLPFLCQTHMTDNHTKLTCHDSIRKEANRANNVTATSVKPVLQPLTVPIKDQLTPAIRQKVIDKYPTVESMPATKPCQACITTGLQDVIDRAGGHSGTNCGNFTAYNTPEAIAAREKRTSDRGGRGGRGGGRGRGNVVPSAAVAIVTSTPVPSLSELPTKRTAKEYLKEKAEADDLAFERDLADMRKKHPRRMATILEHPVEELDEYEKNMNLSHHSDEDDDNTMEVDDPAFTAATMTEQEQLANFTDMYGSYQNDPYSITSGLMASPAVQQELHLLSSAFTALATVPTASSNEITPRIVIQSPEPTSVDDDLPWSIISNDMYNDQLREGTEPRNDDDEDVKALRLYQHEFIKAHPGFTTQHPTVMMQLLPDEITNRKYGPINPRTGNKLICGVRMVSDPENLALLNVVQPPPQTTAVVVQAIVPAENFDPDNQIVDYSEETEAETQQLSVVPLANMAEGTAPH